MGIIAELMRRAHLVLWVALVFLLTTAGELASSTRRSVRRRRPARPWGLEARKVGQLGRRAYAVRFQVVVVSI